MSLRPSYCVVRGCTENVSTEANVVCHRFPTNKVLGEKWLQAADNQHLMKMEYKDIIRKQFKICSAHFRSYDKGDKETDYHSCYAKYVLKPDAVPLLKLPTKIKVEIADSDEDADPQYVDLRTETTDYLASTSKSGVEETIESNNRLASENNVTPQNTQSKQTRKRKNEDDVWTETDTQNVLRPAEFAFRRLPLKGKLLLSKAISVAVHDIQLQFLSED